MEVITIESKAYQEIVLKIEQLHEYFKSFPQKKEVKKDEKEVWLDSNTVCERLNISTRTLYRMRKERLIGFSNLRGHYRFKQSDVEQILQGRLVVSDPETFEEMRQIISK
jgi:excisionase family DNA binding protein